MYDLRLRVLAALDGITFIGPADAAGEYPILDAEEVADIVVAAVVPSAGQVLRDVLAGRGQSQARFARDLGVSEKHMTDLISGRAAVTCAMAIRLERATGVPAATWNALETTWRDARLREKARAAETDTTNQPSTTEHQ